MKYNEFKVRVMAAAKSRSLEEYELYYMESEGFNTEALHHELNSFSTNTEAGACFRCIHDGKIGYASTELFTAEEAGRIVEAAIQNAEAIENTESALIHGAGDTYEDIPPVTTTEPSASQLISLTLDIQEKAYQADSRIIDGTQSFAGFRRTTRSIINSKGLDLSYSCDYTMAGCAAVAGDQGEMFDNYEFKADDFASLDAAKLASGAVADAGAKIGADTVDSGSYPIVFSNKMTATMLSTFFSVFSAEAAQRGMSLLAGKEGQEIAAPSVTVTDDPFPEDSLVRMPFDSEGVATHRKNVVENGRLITLLHNLATAQKAGVSSTGNGQKTSYASTVSIMPYNFYMNKGGAGSREDLFKAAQSGIYITELNGLHAGANPVTGDFSLSSAGFLIENGAKTRPVKNFTISGNFYELLKNIALVGDDLEFQTPHETSCYGAPSIMVKDMAVAGK